MKTYEAPRILMHKDVEFGTSNPSNSFFYKWCQSKGFKPVICWIFNCGCGPGGQSGGGWKPPGSPL